MIRVHEQDRDRRRSIRFPIERELHYRTLDKRSRISTGIGETLNISSSGVLFTAEHTLAVGTRLEVSIGWLIRLMLRSRVRLIVQGTIVRTYERQLAMRIKRYEFRA
jgi:hypothetical protein